MRSLALIPSLLLEENSLSQPWNRILVWGTVGRRERNARSLGSWMPACFISMLVQHSARRAGPGTTSSHVPALLRSGIPSHQSTVVCRPEFGADASPAGSRASPIPIAVPNYCTADADNSAQGVLRWGTGDCCWGAASHCCGCRLPAQQGSGLVDAARAAASSPAGRECRQSRACAVLHRQRKAI